MSAEIETALRQKVQPEAFTLYERIRDRGPLSLEDLCEKGDGTASHWRRLLYELQDTGAIAPARIVRERRTYFVFRVTTRTFFEREAKTADAETARLEAELADIEGHQYYSCSVCGLRQRFEEAYAFDFHCGRCDKALSYVEPTNVVATLRARIAAAKSLARATWAKFASSPVVRLDQPPVPRTTHRQQSR